MLKQQYIYLNTVYYLKFDIDIIVTFILLIIVLYINEKSEQGIPI